MPRGRGFLSYNKIEGWSKNMTQIEQQNSKTEKINVLCGNNFLKRNLYLKTCMFIFSLFFYGLPIAVWADTNSDQADLSRRFNEGKIPGAIRIIVGPEGIRSTAIAGFADVEEKKLLSTDSIFWMASTGKTVTAMAFMILVDEKKASLDDTVAKYLPYMKTLYRECQQADGSKKIVPLKNVVTIRHLLSHTSGLNWLPGFFQNQELSYISLETQTHVYAASAFKFEPGTDWSYSNAGINTVGRIIEVISGMPYEQFVKERIFEPLGMNNTGYQLNEAQIARLAMGYSYDADKKKWIKHTAIDQMSILPYNSQNRHSECGGGLFSTPADMAKLAQMIANHGKFNGNNIISLESLHEICKRQTSSTIKKSYGLGSSVGTVGHGGAWGTSMSVDLDKQQGSIWMVQKAGKWPEDLESQASGK